MAGGVLNTLGFRGEPAPLSLLFDDICLEGFGRLLGEHLVVVIRGDHSCRQLSGTDSLKYDLF